MTIVIFGIALGVIQAGSAMVNQHGCIKLWFKGKHRDLQNSALDIIRKKYSDGICDENNNIE